MAAQLPITNVNIDLTDGPVLLFGGPYSNLLALHALKDVAEKMSIAPTHVICTGDMAAYCAQPEETIRACRTWGIHVVSGNCEEQLAAGADDCGCGFDDGSACDVLSAGWYSFAKARVSPDLCDWMGTLPSIVVFDAAGRKIAVVHGSAFSKNAFVFPSTSRSKKAETLEATGAEIIIAGHSGLPFIEMLPEGVWFNPGVIGMPANDGTRDGWYGIMRLVDGRIAMSTHRLTYASHEPAERLTRAGYANPYAIALESGLWPSVDILPDEERALSGVARQAQEVVF